MRGGERDKKVTENKIIVEKLTVFFGGGIAIFAGVEISPYL